MTHYLINGLVVAALTLAAFYYWRKYDNTNLLFLGFLGLADLPLYLLQYLLKSNTVQVSDQLESNLIEFIFYGRWVLILLLVAILAKASVEKITNKIQ